MKKVYTKPEILFESFTMSTDIAAGCTAIVDNPTEGVCAMLGTGDIAVFSGSISACDFTPTDLGMGTDDQYDQTCYYVPTETSNLFNS